jgi:hypothetical protein
MTSTSYLMLSQETKFDVPSSASNYRELTIGSQATIAAWATTTVGGKANNLISGVGVTGTILAKQDFTSSYSTRSYTVYGFDNNILEQDILQACVPYIDVTLINPGTPSVYPELALTRGDGGSPPKVSIENLETGNINNIIGANPINYLFQLKSGENKLRLYALHPGTSIEFTFSKELI